MSNPMFASEAPTDITESHSPIVTSSVEVVSIYEAKTQLSKLVKRAKAGETIYIGAYGRPEAILAPVPARPEIRFGMLAHLRDPAFDDSIEAWEVDEENTRLFEASANEDWEY